MNARAPHSPSILQRILGRSAIFLGALLLGGCATGPRFSVDAINDPAAKNLKAYHIVSGDPSVPESDLRFQEARRYVETALQGRGYYPAPSPERAEIVVAVQVDIEGPIEKREVRAEPVYGRVGGGYRYVARTVPDGKGGTTTVTVPVYEPPRTEVVGYRDREYVVYTFEKTLRMDAVTGERATDGEAARQAWSVTVKNSDAEDDIREYLPYMAAAAIPYIGENSGKKQEIMITEKSPDFSYVTQNTQLTPAMEQPPES